ncbi:MAG: hypothetical protein CMH27_03380 [Micavibrio sp.]|nr:hypothetical protein [Micavibrio sp.]|tara:strand:+ start:1336 stop:1788 length:453 start_codon:yes stop_codon:yes gene_type:complete
MLQTLNYKTMKILCLAGLVTSVLALGGCVSRDQADAKLVLACQKGVEYLLDDYSMIKSIKQTNFSNIANKMDGDRRVVMDVVVDENYLEIDKTFSCNFFENRGLMGMNYSANLAQIDMGDGDVYGRKDDQILGGMNKWLNITKEVEAYLD